jgi:two-component system, NtrC family, response regulator HydG
MTANILIVDDEKSIRITFESFLAKAGYQVATAADYDEALKRINEAAPDVIFADILLGGKTGIDLLEKVKKVDVDIPVVMITGAPNLETASQAIRLGAFDYISKPVEKELLLDAALRALRFKRVVEENTRFRSNLEAIFRSVQDGIIMVDKELRIVEMNGAAAKICRVSRKTAIGQSFASLPAVCEGKGLEMLQWTIKKQEPVELQRLECRRPDHPAQVISLSACPLLMQGSKSSGAVLVIRDVTRLAALGKDLNERRQFYHIIGQNARMQKIYSLIEDLADFQTTVLITGESGTGKELVAETLHHIGARSQGPLVKVNCAALSESLLESELFGHVKGAFTGAVKDQIGRFQKANGGTIFLDEIGEISPKMQLHLLRVLQEMEFERVGDSTPIRVNVRVIAATNRNLGERVHLGEFREDLYYRLNVVEIPVPPLRDRLDDLPLLVDHLLKKLNWKFNKVVVALTEQAQRLLMNYPWPGNVRELEHALEHAFVLCRGDSITADHLPVAVTAYTEGQTVPTRTKKGILNCEAIEDALEKTAWKISRAALLLGVDRRTVYRKMKTFGIERKTRAS